VETLGLEHIWFGDSYKFQGGTGVSIKANGSVKLGFQVTNQNISIGSVGTIQMPTTTSTVNTGNADGFFGNATGCMGLAEINSSFPRFWIKGGTAGWKSLFLSWLHLSYISVRWSYSMSSTTPPQTMNLTEYVGILRNQIVLAYDGSKEIALKNFDDITKRLVDQLQINLDLKAQIPKKTSTVEEPVKEKTKKQK